MNVQELKGGALEAVFLTAVFALVVLFTAGGAHLLKKDRACGHTSASAAHAAPHP